MRGFWSVLAFLTRLPVPYAWQKPIDFAKGMRFFPWVGLVMGFFQMGLAYLLVPLQDPALAACLLALLHVMLTGGLHLDGVADSFDGLYSSRSPQRILEIMKDSRVGTHGLLAVFFFLALRVLLVRTFLSEGALWAVLLSPVAGKLASVVGSYRAVSARPEGMGSWFIGKVPAGALFQGSVSCLAILALSGLWAGKGVFLWSLAGLLLSCAWVLGWRRRVSRLLGGITGDLLGAFSEGAELSFLAVCYVGVKVCVK